MRVCVHVYVYVCICICVCMLVRAYVARTYVSILFVPVYDIHRRYNSDQSQTSLDEGKELNLRDSSTGQEG